MQKRISSGRLQSKHSEFNLSSGQIRMLIEQPARGRDRLMVSLLAFTGIRRAELRNIRLEDIDLERQRILIRDGKGSKSRFVFFAVELNEDILRERDSRESGYLFCHANGTPLSLRTVNNVVASAAKKAGLVTPNPRYKNVTPHLLRHSFARHWKRAAGSLESLQKILGHASFSTTMDLYGTESLDETNHNYLATIDKMLG